MSEIQCNNVTSSKRQKKHALQNSIRKIIKESIQLEKTQKPSSDEEKSAILKLVKRNLQKMCQTKSPTSPNVTARCQDDENVESPELRQPLTPFFDCGNCNYNLERSKSTKELLRKTILEKRNLQFGLIQMKQEDFCMDFKQKIWRPW